jgi:hypothetical protein
VAALSDRPQLVALDPTAARVDCAAETYDGVTHRRCTRPASFTRDGLLLCWQHAKLPNAHRYVSPR